MEPRDRRDLAFAVALAAAVVVLWPVFRYGWVDTDLQRWLFPITFGALAIDRARRIPELVAEGMPGPALLNTAFGLLCLLVAVTFTGLIFNWPAFTGADVAAILRPTWPAMAWTWLIFVRQYRRHMDRNVEAVDAFLLERRQ